MHWCHVQNRIICAGRDVLAAVMTSGSNKEYGLQANKLARTKRKELKDEKDKLKVLIMAT